MFSFGQATPPKGFDFPLLCVLIFQKEKYSLVGKGKVRLYKSLSY